MKKTALLAVALAACLGYVPARATEVVSTNIVGYSKISLHPGYNAISAQFVPVGALEVTNILDIAECTVLPTMNKDSEYGYARLQTWDSGRYTTYEWTGEGIAAAWDWDGIDNKWMTMGCVDIAEVSLDNGQGFWLWLDPNVISSPIDLTVAGEVPTASTITVPLHVGYNLIANPFPQEIDIQNIVFNNLPTMNPESEYGYARLQTWASGKYTTYEWTGEGIAAAWDWDGIDNKWMTMGCVDIAEGVKIGVGAGFWLWLDPACPNLSNNVSATFTNPTK